MSTKTVYLYDPSTGEYLRDYQAQESPMQPGEFIAPTHSVELAPAVMPGTWPVWQNGQWINLPDLRGTQYYLPDGSQHEVTEIGFELPAGATLSPPILPPSINQLLSNLERELKRRWRAGFPVSVAGEVKWFHSDEFSLTQHLGLKDQARDILAAGGVMTDAITIAGQPVSWFTMDGSQVTITVQLAFDLVSSAGLQQALVFSASQAHESAINAAEDLSDYDVTANWPAVFGD